MCLTSKKKWRKKRLSKKWIEIPLELRKSKPYIQASLSVNGNALTTSRLLIDTGASNALSLFEREHAPPEKTIATYLGQGLNGDIYGKLGKVKQLQIGKFTLNEVVTAFPDSASLKVTRKNELWQGNLGGGTLRRFRVIISYPHQYMLLRQNGDLRKPFDYNRSGVEILATGANFNQFVVSYVRPGSAAQAAGLQINDRIISINGAKTLYQDIGDLYEKLNKVSGKPLHLRILRNDKKLNVVFAVREGI